MNAVSKIAITPLKPSQIKPSNYVRQTHTLIVNERHTLEDLHEPGIWAALAPNLNVWDKIEVISEDSSWIAELLVVGVSRTWVQIRTTLYVNFDEEEGVKPPSEDARHVVKWRGPIMKWCVVRIADNSNIADKLPDRDAASKALGEYEKALAR